MKQNSLDLQPIRIGVKERLMGQNISAFCLLNIKRYPPAQPIYAIMTNNQEIYLFDNHFSSKHQKERTTQNLLHLAYLKVDLRHQYKLPSPLHLKLKYSYTHQFIFTLLEDGSMAVFNYDLYLLQNMKLSSVQKKIINSKYCIDYDYHQTMSSYGNNGRKSGYFIFLFSDIIEIHELQINTNHKYSNYKSAFKFTLTPLNRYIIDNSISHPISLALANGLQQRDRLQSNLYIKKVIVCNCSKQMYFYLYGDDISEVINKFIVNKKNEYGVYITDYQINFNSSKIYISLSNGIIQVYGYKQGFFGKLLTTIKICTSNLLKIYLLSFKKMYCYSEDNNLYMINLQTLTVQQKYQIGNYSFMQFISENMFIGVGFSLNNAYFDINARYKEYKCLIMNTFNVKYNNLFPYSSEILHTNVTDKSSLILFSDNSIIYQPYVHSMHHKEFSTYLPPNTVTVKCLAINPFNASQDHEECWILTDKSSIYKYRFSSSSAPKVQQILQLNKFYDKQNIQLRYSITYFTFLKRIVCMEYDSQSTGNELNKNNINREGQRAQSICLGTMTGQIIIVSLEKISKIICRLKFLSKPITFIMEMQIYEENTESKGLLVYGSQAANKWFITELQQLQIPIERYRLVKDHISLKLINDNLLALINENSFHLTYFAKDKNSSIEYSMYIQEHFTPVLIPNSAISVLTYLQQNQSQFILSGYSLGEVLIYQMTITTTDKIEVELSLSYVIQNSSMPIIEYVCYRYERLMFGLNRMVVEYKLPRIQEQMVVNSQLKNFQIADLAVFIKGFKSTGKVIKSQVKNRSSFKQEKSRVKSIQKRDLKYISVLPKIKQSSSLAHKKRSASFNSIYTSKNKEKPDNLFHFPDIMLYRNLIQKNIII